MITNSFLRRMGIAGLALICTSGAMASDKEQSPVRYKLIAGKGYTVCEACLKHLNALPKDDPPSTCEVKLAPQFKNFSEPPRI